jgi:hypothetical protein
VTGLSVALNLSGGGDDVIYTTGWRLEEGDYPSKYLTRPCRPAPPARLEPVGDNLLPIPATPDGQDWQRHLAVLSHGSYEIPPYISGEQVLEHRTSIGVDGVVFDRSLQNCIESGQPLVLSVRVWIPSGFRGKAAVPVLVGFFTSDAQAADLMRRDCWQRIWAKAIVPSGHVGCAPGLRMTAEPGDNMITYSPRAGR